MPAELYLSTEEIDVVVESLRAKDGEYISRGRGGDGLGYRDGQFLSISVEESDRNEVVFSSEEDFRGYLARAELGDPSRRYLLTVLESLGAMPAFDVEDALAQKDAFERQARVAIVPPSRWRGIARAIERWPDVTYVRLSVGDTPKVYAMLAEVAERELAGQGVRLRELVGHPLRLEATLVQDRPEPGCIALDVRTLVPWSPKVRRSGAPPA